MSLGKTSILNGSAMIIKLLVSLIANKVIAMMLGPQGLAIYGQFQSLMTLVNGLASASGQAGVVRLTASHCHEPLQLTTYWSAAFRTVLLSSIIFASVGILTAPWLAQYVLQNNSLTWPLVAFFVTVPASALTTLFMSCANGVSAIKNYVVIGLISALSISTAVILGVAIQGIAGAIILVGIAQLLALYLVFYYLRKQAWFDWGYFRHSVSKNALRQVFSLAAMVVVAVICAPLTQIAIRYFMSDISGLVEVGYWQAISRLGDMFVMMLTTLFGVYYFPRFSALTDIKELRKEIKIFLIKIYPLFLLSYSFFVVFKDFFINVVYSSEFLPAGHLLVSQMILDAIRVLSWLIGYLVMARGSSVVFVSVEVIVALISVLGAYVLMQYYGSVGAIYAAIIANLIYVALLSLSLVKSKHI
jgi:O-antigen/teichoic acid export membrane protein